MVLEYVCNGFGGVYGDSRQLLIQCLPQRVQNETRCELIAVGFGWSTAGRGLYRCALQEARLDQKRRQLLLIGPVVCFTKINDREVRVGKRLVPINRRGTCWPECCS